MITGYGPAFIILDELAHMPLREILVDLEAAKLGHEDLDAGFDALLDGEPGYVCSGRQMGKSWINRLAEMAFDRANEPPMKTCLSGASAKPKKHWVAQKDWTQRNARRGRR